MCPTDLESRARLNSVGHAESETATSPKHRTWLALIGCPRGNFVVGQHDCLLEWVAEDTRYIFLNERKIIEQRHREGSKHKQNNYRSLAASQQRRLTVSDRWPQNLAFCCNM